ncbi:MAG TPA: hypothetical protein VFD43_13900, partial [Planctomycetota bacterium]|nr:hypothetical protein [Planctomycetota bacterium]
MRRKRGRLRLLAALLVLAAGALEVVVRVAGLVDLNTGVATPHQAAFNAAGLFVDDDDPSLSYRNRSLAATSVDGIEYRHDERGRRVLPGVAGGGGDGSGGAATGGRPRVAFLGDSTTYGLGLAAQDTLPAQVAAELDGRIEALDLGVCGYGTGQEAALYAAERGHLDGVALVVLVVFPNDFAPGTFRWDERLRLMYLDPMPLPHGLKGALWRSALYRWIVSGVTARRAAAGEFDALNPANRGQALDSVARLAGLVSADGRPLLVAHLPAMERLDPYLFEEPVRELARACSESGLPFADLLPAFLAERERQSARYVEHFGHPPTA